MIGRCHIYIVFFLCACMSCHQGNRKMPSLRETYSATDKNPFGSYVAFERLSEIFSEYSIIKNTEPMQWEAPDEGEDDDDRGYMLYFIVTKNLELSKSEADDLVAYAKSGNDLFISADYIEPRLLQQLFTSVNRTGELEAEAAGLMKKTGVQMFFSEQIKTGPYEFYYFPFLNYIESYDENFARVLGVNDNGQPNFVVFFTGAGRVYLHVAPRTFSNYFLLKADNYQYFENVISFLRLEPARVVWDAYYQQSDAQRNRPDNNPEFSSLKVVRENQGLWWAFWLVVAGMLLYALFATKRRQRPLPLFTAPENTTVAFTQTIGRLYLPHKNNKQVAIQMTRYFLEAARQKYHLAALPLTDAGAVALAAKSGTEIHLVKNLFDRMIGAHTKEELTDDELQILNHEIEKFNKTRYHD